MVIIGAGFAGLACAKELAGKPVEVMVIDRHNYHTFLPLLYQVASSALAPTDVAYPVRGIFRKSPNVSVRRGLVTGVDWNAREANIEGGRRLGFDYLVVAAGATTNWFAVPGASEHALPLYGVEDSIALRNHVLAQLEAAEWEAAEGGVGDPHMGFVIVGGGPTGVEMAGALQELFDHVVTKEFPRLNRLRPRISLVEMAGTVLSPFSATARRHAAAQLRRRGVDLRLGARVSEVTPDEVVLASGERIRAKTVIWAAGVRAVTLADQLGLPQASSGRVMVDADLTVPGRQGAFAVGDIAAIPTPAGELLPQLAPVAKQSGAFVGRSIAGLVGGEPAAPFRFKDRGTMATIGRNSAVADLPGRVHLTGRPAWWAWLLLHLVFLVGFRNRLSVLLDWTWNFLTYGRGPRVIIGQLPRGGDDE